MSISRLLRPVLLAALALCTTLGVSTMQAQQTDPDAFAYTGALRAGRTVHIHNLNGSIEVVRASGGQVELRAKKQWRRGDPNDVRIVQLAGEGGDIVVCALWNDAECSASGMRTRRNSSQNNRNDVSVHFTLRVPDGVHVDVNTVNGAVSVEGVSGLVDANTVNGSVTARSTGGPVHAKTVNGSILATMGVMGREDLRYSTVNGSITLELPAGIDADLDVSTVNGRVNTDFPVTIQGAISRKHLRGIIGDGGRMLKASTVNGSVTLKRAG